MRRNAEMQHGVYVKNVGEYSNPHNLIGLALDAEKGGGDGFFICDHLLLYRHSDIPFFRRLGPASSDIRADCASLGGEAFSHHGDFFHIDNVKFVPRVVQSPRVSVWVAGF
jgi:alkanesulfonate monooxygenase SsuD/methylene tetrahydromethanopterin reductase-like flavin-dependent oxidoreductase (luciferase family)